MTQQTSDPLDELQHDVEQEQPRRIEPGLLDRSAELVARIDRLLAAGPTGSAL